MSGDERLVATDLHGVKIGVVASVPFFLAATDERTLVGYSCSRCSSDVRAKDFALAIYKEVIPHLPADEKSNLTQQLKRSSQSIPANIAEGHGRYHFLDNVRFCYIARGSLTEVQSHVTLAHDLGYLSDETYKQMTSHAGSIGKQLNNYIAYLKRSKQGEKEFPEGYTVHEGTEPYILDNPDEDSTNH